MSKELLELRKRIKAKKPVFIRQDAHKKKRLAKNWRRPKGIQSKMRLKRKGYRRSVSKGFKSPREVRGLHKSGVEPVLISSPKELKVIEKGKQGVIISKGVGLRKRIEIAKEAEKAGIRVLNIKDTKKFIEKVEESIKQKKEEIKKIKSERERKKVEVQKKKKEEKKTEEEKKEEEKKEKDKVLIKKQ